MFNFKPRVYRSAEGCCICRAKSSSSRFTESQKYEEDFIKCFDLKHPRHGQICNACVLLVKRYKRLPAGSQRNWSHVVDARAGPGTKTLMKVKRNKDEKSRDMNNLQSRHIGKTMISEKFSKIFKKSKKMKLQQSSLSPGRRETQTPPTNHQPNSIDSDNEESSESSQELSKTSSPTPPTIVLFQTQTRASAFRSRHNKVVVNKPPMAAMTKSSNDLIIRNSLPTFNGSKKRKKLKPKKLQHPLEFKDEVKFFDDSEWIQQTTCCGIFYECAKLNGAIIIDVDQYKVCQHHRHHQTKETKTNDPQQPMALNLLPKQKCVIKATLPAVVKLSLPFTTLNASNNMKSTPVLKKHHLFFKRQSESFPKEDSVTTTTLAAVPILGTVKTDDDHIEADSEQSTSLVQAQHQQHSSALTAATTIITTVPSSVQSAAPPTVNVKSSSSLLHKIKSDAGKIVKHSFEKFNTAVRLKAHDLAEIKHLVKTVDKNYLLTASTPTTITTNAAPNGVIAVTKATTTPSSTIEDLSTNLSTAAPSSATTTTKFSDNSSDSGFDENVQDRKSVSPLQQENDTKNILPPRPPVQTLILASGVRVHGQAQNLVYAGNEAAAKILQNRITKQNSNAILQNNKRLNVQQVNNSIDQSNITTTTTPSSAVATLKLVQPPTKNNPNCLVSIGAYGGVKMRALYTNNTIKHENGITTILPASSLAAANQSNQISLQANAPNTITITPAASAVAIATVPPTSATSALSSSLRTIPLSIPHSVDGYHHHHQQTHNDTLTTQHMHNRRAI